MAGAGHVGHDAAAVVIVDPKRGILIYSRAVDGAPRQFVADGLAHGYREDADGDPRVELVSLQFTPGLRR